MHPERLHALVVDREPRVRSTVKSVLSAIGFQVKETGDARDAVSIVDRQPCLDLLVTEAQPLNFDGRTLADRYLTICPLGRVIMMSRFGEVDAINAESTGGWIFLPRERVGEMLLPALKNLVYRKRRIVLPDSCC